MQQIRGKVGSVEAAWSQECAGMALKSIRCIVWSTHGGIHCELLEKGPTVTCDVHYRQKRHKLITKIVPTTTGQRKRFGPIWQIERKTVFLLWILTFSTTYRIAPNKFYLTGSLHHFLGEKSVKTWLNHFLLFFPCTNVEKTFLDQIVCTSVIEVFLLPYDMYFYLIVFSLHKRWKKLSLIK